MGEELEVPTDAVRRRHGHLDGPTFDLIDSASNKHLSAGHRRIATAACWGSKRDRGPCCLRRSQNRAARRDTHAVSSRLRWMRLDTVVGGFTEQPIPPPPEREPRTWIEGLRKNLRDRGFDPDIDPDGEWRPGNRDMDTKGIRDSSNQPWSGGDT